MSCIAPFVYNNVSNIISSNNIGFIGTTTISECSIPSITTCTPIYTCTTNPTTLVETCNTNQECRTIPGILIFPAYTLSATANTLITTNSSTNIILPVSTPKSTIIVDTLTITSGSITITLNMTGVGIYINTYNIVPTSIVVPQTNNNFATTITLAPSFGTDSDILTWSSTANLLFCLNPQNGNTWMNIAVAYTIIYNSVETSTNLILPIMSVN